MPLRLEVKKKLSATSDRVKSVDIHPTEPWVLAALYSGHLFIWNYTNNTLVKSIEVCELPVRTAKFVPRKQWIICGADDMQIRIYNYNTTERIKSFEAHSDYIRSLAVHPTLPYLLTSSDDMTIKLWDWEKNWNCIQTYEGHSHYVMQVEFNPKDPTTFASASLDRTIKVWGLNSVVPHFSLEGHERGVNCISYFAGGEKPFLVSGADDQQVRIWDYQTKACVATLEGHGNNVSAVAFHPQLPIIISGSEDGTVRIWHSTTYRLENTLNYGMERVWSLCCLPASNKVAIGYDDGTIMVKLGQEEPVISLDNSGKIIMARNHELLSANVKAAIDQELTDGERIVIGSKDMGACEIFPQYIEHSPNGRFVVVCGDGEYIIYTALALKNQSFGQALEFAWAADSKSYAVRESASRVKVFKNFKETHNFRPLFAAEGMFGGSLLALRSNEFVDFYDWDTMRLVRRIAVTPKRIYWSSTGDLCIIVCDASYYVLRYNRELVQKFFDQGIEIPDQGIDDAFEVEAEISEKVLTGVFAGDCFIYNNSGHRLSYFIGGQVMTLAHLDRPMYVLGYLQKENRVYLTDKQLNVVSFQLLLGVLIYQTAIVRRDFELAERTLASIPQTLHNKLAHFLEGQDLKDLALQVTSDPEHKFELAVQLHRLELAESILESHPETESQQKWRQLGDLALSDFTNLQLAINCFSKAEDMSSLLLIYSSLGDKAGMLKLAEQAARQGRFNVAFIAYFVCQRVDKCVDLLCESNRIPEAAFMARTYAPSLISKVLELWRVDLSKVSTRAASSLADPAEYPDVFPDLDLALQVESYIQDSHNKQSIPAFAYADYLNAMGRNLLQEARDGILFTEAVSEPAQPPAPAFASASSSSSSSSASSFTPEPVAPTVIAATSVVADEVKAQSQAEAILSALAQTQGNGQEEEAFVDAEASASIDDFVDEEVDALVGNADISADDLDELENELSS